MKRKSRWRMRQWILLSLSCFLRLGSERLLSSLLTWFMTLSLIVSMKPCSRRRIFSLNRSLYLLPKRSSSLRSSSTMWRQRFTYHPSQSRFNRDIQKTWRWCSIRLESLLNQNQSISKTRTRNLTESVQLNFRIRRDRTLFSPQIAKRQANI